MKSTLLAGLLLLSFLVQSRPVDAGSAAEFAMVEKVIDGDTIQLAGGERVRYIGIDASELSSKECYSAEAKKANEKLVKGKKVKLVRDKSNEPDPGWKSLSKKYLRKFSTEKEINLTFPSYQLHQPCK